MAEKPTIPDFPNLPDFGQMISQACEVVANVRGIPYDFNGALSLENKFVVLFKTVKEMFDAQDVLVKSYKELYEFVNNYFNNLDLQEEINKYVNTHPNAFEIKDNSITKNKFVEKLRQDISYSTSVIPNNIVPSYLNNENINDNDFFIVNDNVPLSKENFKKIKNKNFSGNGTIYFNNWISRNGIISKYAKIKFLQDDIYMSMKTPSDTVSTYLTDRTNGAAYNIPSTYNLLTPIGSIYATNSDTLPEKFNLFFGKMLLFTFKNNIWEEIENDKYIKNINNITLPWNSESEQTNLLPKCVFYENYTKLECTKEMLTNKVIHFFGNNNFINETNTNILCCFEVWTDAETITNNVFSAIGVDSRKRGSGEPVFQVASGNNQYIKLHKNFHFCHNITDEIYENNPFITYPTNITVNFNKRQSWYNKDNIKFTIPRSSKDEMLLEFFKYDMTENSYTTISGLITNNINVNAKNIQVPFNIKILSSNNNAVTIICDKDYFKYKIINNVLYVYFYYSTKSLYYSINITNPHGDCDKIILNNIFYNFINEPYTLETNITANFIPLSSVSDLKNVTKTDPYYEPDFVSIPLENILKADYPVAYNSCNYFNETQAQKISSELPYGFVFITYKKFNSANNFFSLQTFTCFDSNGIKSVFMRNGYNNAWSTLKQIV